MGAIQEDALRLIVDALVRDHPGDIPLDALGDAMAGLSGDPAQVEWIIDAVEAHGRKIAAAGGPSGIEALRKVIPTARALAEELGRPARPAEIALRTALGETEVRRALLLATVMGR